jgi:YD repeat-containing protein
LLGRGSRATTPTEIDSSFTPAGDDVSGWLWKHTKYDWKDRVVRKINTDGTDSPVINDSDVLISYDGCGCAGGVEITIKGEEIVETDYQGNNPVSLGRRTRKVFQDILGRTTKTQIMEWDGTTVYSTTVNEYNGRDQATTITQYVDEGPATTSQVTSMTYDGFGRLLARHRPEQDAGKNTVFTYNVDDSVASVTDARGATTSYDYEERGLVSEISYSVPQGSSIGVPATVEIDYDAAGNRTSMNDGMGSVSYAVTELSQLASETRSFTDTLTEAPLTGNSFKIEYAYTFGGSLKSLKDPFGQEFTYGHDNVGRLDSVAGATAFDGITDYADNSGYRAWGALKHLEFGNGGESDVTFDSRLRPTSYKLTDGSTNTLIDKTYSYYSDGNVKYTADTVNNKHDDFYKFDHKGRVLDGRSAIEARGGTETDLTKLPYRNVYGYDEFDNTTSYEITNWDVSETDTFTYTNHRRDSLPSTAYDEEGNRKLEGWRDAAGRITYFYEGWANLNRYWDGDNHEVKRENRVYDFVAEEYEDPDIAYYIRSSVLGGQIVTEADDTGAKAQTFVWAGGKIVARQLYVGANHDEEKVVWDYKDPVRSTSKYLDDQLTDVSATIDTIQSGEYNPIGGFVLPYYFPPNPHAGQTNARQRVPSPLFELNAGGCTVELDGVPESCDLVFSHTGRNEHLAIRIVDGDGNVSYHDFDQFLTGHFVIHIPGEEPETDTHTEVCVVEDGDVGCPPTLIVDIPERTPDRWVFVDASWSSQSPTFKDLIADKKFLKKLDSCLGSIFDASRMSVGGSVGRWLQFDGSIDGETVQLVTNFSKSAAELGSLMKSGDRSYDESPQSGYTPGTFTLLSRPSVGSSSDGVVRIGGNTTYLQNWIASEIGKSQKVSAKGVLALFIHELGNGLGALRYYRQFAAAKTREERNKVKGNHPFANQSKPTDQGDSDIGTALERCVFGGIVNLSTGRVGNRRGFNLDEL